MNKKVFLSYCTFDQIKMQSLKRAINKTNELDAVVISDRKFPGKTLGDKVIEGINESDYILPILTNKAISNQWVNQEIGFSIAAKKSIFPIIEKETLNKLKGFLNKNIDMPYVYRKNTDKTKEAENFRKCYKALLNDILDLGQQKNKEKSRKISDSLEMTHVFDYNPKNILIEREIKNTTKFSLRVETSSINQNFIAYCLIETDKLEKKWIGYSSPGSKPYTRDNEVTKPFVSRFATRYAFDENITNTIRQRFPSLVGNPNKVKIIRFRGDKTDNSKITFYYGFSD